ncbi:VWA domain-containing protein [Acinetobacter sp. 194]|uniref:VWA domain-containing protein n=1 Tax=Acinetobacter shaoyimingii TaxID=2715164 RepID=UPI00140B838C|nr:VWA domain-containing protein [Acinetobacter shaoyimingii]NHB58373.1 VWA domain-containing protein [Acinetobacter shaoyimingii]
MKSPKHLSSDATSSILEQATQQLYDELEQSTLRHWLKDHKVAKNLDEKVRQWAFQAKSSLDQQHPFMTAQKQLQGWLELSNIDGAQFRHMLSEYQEFNHLLGAPDLTEMLKPQADLDPSYSKTPTSTLQFQLLKEKWQRKLTQAVAHWEFEQLALQRDAFLDEMKDFLATLQKMSKHKDSLGIETGVFIDYSSGKLTPQDVQQFEEWLSYLEHDAELLKLCKMIGSAQPAQHHRKALPVTNKYSVEDVIEQQAKEEIVGIQLSKELSLALPSELALLADPELQILFDLKYLESNLMSFNMQGQQSGRVIEDQHQYKRKLGQKGPMVICLDTSGSMHGQPELIAKAMTLYLAMQAMKTKRAMYIINFSTNLTALNLNGKTALDELIHFLSQSFHGGTDILPAIEHAVDMLVDPHFQHADVVVISDFIMGQLNDELMEKIIEQKQQGNGFYAVAIGNLSLDHLDEELFDHQWIYQSNHGKVVKVH